MSEGVDTRTVTDKDLRRVLSRIRRKGPISLRDIVSAVLGSLLVLAALWLWRRFGTSQENT